MTKYKTIGIAVPTRGHQWSGEVECVKCGALVPWHGAKPSEQVRATFTCCENESRQKKENES